MKILYYDKKTEEICTDFNKAKKYFGGNSLYAISLMARINAIDSAVTLNDIVVFPPFHFHKLENKGKGKNLKGYFAIDVKTRKEKWRIILEPLKDNEESFDQCNIDELARVVKVVGIKEVSDHYE